MTLPASGAISLEDVLAELRVTDSARALPIGLDDSDVRALAGKPSGDISLTDLYGKSSYVPMSATMPDVSDSAPAGSLSPYNVAIPVTLNLNGGLAPFSVSWAHISGTGTIDNVNATSSTARMPDNKTTQPGDVETQVVQCSVQDAKGNTITKQCTVTLTLV